jgi:hypothetical protein
MKLSEYKLTEYKLTGESEDLKTEIKIRKK